MKREIVNIDEEVCNGCGVCIPNCHEGALQIIDGKARLISDLMCDGLGACIGHCPLGAITMEEREAQAYDEILVMQEMTSKGKNTVIAHLKHLKDHKEFDYLKQGVKYLKENSNGLSFSADEVIGLVHNYQPGQTEVKEERTQQMNHQHHGGGCPSAQAKSFAAPQNEIMGQVPAQASALTHWPVQMHLINPASAHFKGSDFVIAADCTAFAMGRFHSDYLNGKTLGIACPKLDQGMEVYIEKLVSLIDDSKINTLNVVIMEVPCCRGLLQMAKTAADKASRKVPIKLTVVGIQGEIRAEDWI
ncbi:MAG: 4Fe-4S ferredoxin [Bacteroidales bacterium]|nr:4Fe-4S ferredoxin [Bacteroidales bacterium]